MKIHVIMGLLVAGLIPLISAPAAARVNQNQAVKTIIIPQADSPVIINSCGATANDWYDRTASPPTYIYTMVTQQVAFTYVGSGVSPPSVTVVRFGFEVDDSFNTFLGDFTGTTNGNYSLGVTIQPHRAGLLNLVQPDASVWSEKVANEDIGAVGCWVNDVKFSDGSVWKANIKSEIKADTPKPSPTPFP